MTFDQDGATYYRLLKYLDLKYEYEAESFVIDNNGHSFTSDFKINDTHFIELRCHKHNTNDNPRKIANFKIAYSHKL